MKSSLRLGETREAVGDEGGGGGVQDPSLTPLLSPYFLPLPSRLLSLTAGYPFRISVANLSTKRAHTIRYSESRLILLSFLL